MTDIQNNEIERDPLFNAEALFGMLEDFFEELGDEVEKVDTDELHVLIAHMTDFGKIQHSIGLEMMFMFMPNTEDKVIMANIATAVFKDIPEENIPTMIEACNYLNANTIIGKYVMNGNTLVYSTNAILGFDHPLYMCFDIMCNTIISMTSMLELTVDALAMLGRGMCDLEEAKENYFFKVQ